MAVPDEVRKVERPKNTVVISYGKNNDRYAVKIRIGCVRVEGKKNPQPKTGQTIGHIIRSPTGKWKYVPQDGITRIAEDEIDRKDWGDVWMCIMVSEDILDDLNRCYSPNQAMQLYCIAILRACRPGIRDSKLREKYLESFLSEIMPGIALSKNTVCDLLEDVGKANNRMKSFMEIRVKKIEPSHHLVMDSTLKKNKSRINSFSEMSRKTDAEYPMVSIMYAFNLELMEPVAMEVYPGNMVDARAFSDFVKKHKIEQGIVVVDKGFPRTSAEEYFEKHPDLHYIIPLKDNNSLIGRYGMLEFDTPVKGYENIIGKKLFIGDRWLYAFRDINRAARDEKNYVRDKKNDFDSWEYDRDCRAFGTIVFESNLELDLDVVYKAYECRWVIELMFRMYKTVVEQTDTREHDDYSVMASEFINFLSVIITGRLFKKFTDSGLLEDRTYGDIMDILRSAKKQKDSDGNWSTIRVIEKNAKVLEALGLAGGLITIKNPVGHPKKSGT